MTPLITHPEGHFRFLPLRPDLPFSAGVIATDGHEIVRATFRAPVPYQEGFARAAGHLEELGRSRASLCAVELRSPAPYQPDSFAVFNDEYRRFLERWHGTVEGQAPAARSNLAPALPRVGEPSLYAFSYVVPARASGESRTFVVSGAPEAPGVRPGEISPEALAEKTANAIATVERSMAALGVDWKEVTGVQVYSTHSLHSLLERSILGPIGPAAWNGIQWFFSSPPVVGFEIELDARGIRAEIRMP